MVHQLFKRLPILFLNHDNKFFISVEGDKSTRSHRAYVDLSMHTKDDLGLATERLRESGFSITDDTGSVTMYEEEVADFNLRTVGLLGRSKGKIDMYSSYDSRTNGMEHFLAATRDLWRVDLRIRVLQQAVELRISFFSSLDYLFSYVIQCFYYHFTYQSNTCYGLDMIGRKFLKRYLHSKRTSIHGDGS